MIKVTILVILLAIGCGVLVQLHDEYKLNQLFEKIVEFTKTKVEIKKEFMHNEYQIVTDKIKAAQNSNFKFSGSDEFESWNGVQGELHTLFDSYIQNVSKLVDQQKGWELQSTFGNVTIETNPSLELDGNAMFRLKGTLDVDPHVLISLLLDAESLGTMDETVVYCGLMDDSNPQHKSGNFSLAHTVVNPGPGMQLRDFLDITGWKEDKETGTLLQASFSVNTPNAAPQLDFIRGKTMTWLYKMDPVKRNGKTLYNVTLLSQTELGGMLPKSLSNMMAGQVIAKAYFNVLEYAAQRIVEHGVSEQLKQTLFV